MSDCRDGRRLVWGEDPPAETPEERHPAHREGNNGLMFSDELWADAERWAVDNITCPFVDCRAPAGQECKGRRISHAARTIEAAHKLEDGE